MLARWRTITFGFSCLVHVGFVALVLLAQHWMVAHTLKPAVLPIVLVTEEDPAPVDPPPVRTEARPPNIPKPSRPKPVSLPRPIETPPPRVDEIASEPPRIEPPQALAEPVAPTPPAPPAPTPPAPPVQPPATAAAPSSPSAPAGTPSDGRPVADTPAPARSAAPAEGVALGRQAPVGSTTAVAAAPSPSVDATNGVTRYARPQGGYQVRPGYPASARRLGIQGTAMLKVHVLVDGRVGDVLVEASAGHPDLDQAAADAVRRWRFEPARRGDDAVAMWVRLPVEFRLK